MTTDNFIQTFLDCLQPGQHVLDLGAGEGEFALMFVERGAKVTVVDPRFPRAHNKMINSRRMNIKEYCTADGVEKFDLVFARNVLQFLDQDWVFRTLFPWMEEHSNPRGIIAMATFYQDPEPPFAHPIRSLYSLRELQRHFLTWTDLHAREYSHQGFDMSGQPRKFFISSLIVRRTH